MPRTKRNSYEVPKNRNEANRFITDIGQIDREIDEVDTILSKRIAELKAVAADKTAAMTKKKETLLDGLHAYGEANREDLTNNGKQRSAKFPAGIIGWRFTPPSVNLKNKTNVLKILKQLKLRKFIRITEDVNKEAMLDDRKKAVSIEGVSITQREEFYVTPEQHSTEIVKKIRTFHEPGASEPSTKNKA